MTSQSSGLPTGVRPAQLGFLAMYNPSLGPTDETFDQQLVFHYSRAAHEVRVTARKHARVDAAGGDALRAEENEKLRQIGLAQGMVDFARSFSNGEAVDSIETEKSRIVLRELEKGWWILASVDLTRLPSFTQSSSVSSKKGPERPEAKPTVEYSSREVTPAALLLEQLQQAHQIFCLHHGPSLSDLWVRLSRDKFCSTLERFWTRFSRSWDVLLHGNPAADIFSGLKVSSGGELGFGVGEEEWGSGERDVLEDLTRRTEGLVDLVVSRFGEPTPKDKEQSTVPESEALPWIGSGHEPGAADGIIFGGVGAIERHSLRDVSLWMRQIYTNGEYAYGIKDNPQRERRKRKRQNPAEPTPPSNGALDQERDPSRNADRESFRRQVQTANAAKLGDQNLPDDVELPKDPRPEIHPRVVSHDHVTTPQETPSPHSDATQPKAPPLMASAVEQALSKATVRADQDAARATIEAEKVNEEEASATTLGIPDQYMKYLTFGLSTFAKPAPNKRPPNSRKASTAASSKPSKSQNKAPPEAGPFDDDDEIPATMTKLQPIPDGESLQYKIALQKRLEKEGYFLVGLKGDLTAPPADEDANANASDGGLGDVPEESRIVLRTVQLKVVSPPGEEDDDQLSRRPSLARAGSAGASDASKGFRRFRAIIYARRPFIYCFLFEANTSSLQYTSFYRTLRQDLVPIHKPLLSSTNASKVAQRIEDSHLEPNPAEAETASIASLSSKNNTSSKTTPPSPIFDLIYDPRLLTVHTSIPNIPEPGTPAAEGIFSTTKTEPAVPGWTRIEAMNVHSQILNTLANARKRRTEIERTSKTSRGWWVVWMKVPPSAASPAEEPSTTQSTTSRASDSDVSTKSTDDTSLPTINPASTPAAAKSISADLSRIAFLVRRASDSSSISSSSGGGAGTNVRSSSRAMSNMFSNMTFGLAGSSGRSEEEVTGGASAGWGPQAPAGGMGVDARKYVEGLLSLGR